MLNVINNPIRGDRMNKVGKKLKQKMNEKNITQAKLSKQSGVSQSYICDLINENSQNPSVLVIQKIANALEIPLTDLI